MLTRQPYSQWVDLIRAIELITSKGHSAEIARERLCAGIDDGLVRFRAFPGKRTDGMTAHMVVFEEKELEYHRPLTPEHLDFVNSRPTNRMFVPGEKRHGMRGWWSIKRLQVFAPDVQALTQAKANVPTCAETSRAQAAPVKAVRRPKTPAARERAARIVHELYPDGLPNQALLPNGELCRQVSLKGKELGLPGFSDDTILRAAGRRK